MLALVPGSVDAFVLDRDLAVRLADEERREQDDEVSTADAIDRAPAYDEDHLPDPFAAPPRELEGL